MYYDAETVAKGEPSEVKKMVAWFLDTYEDPAENTPYDGGYVYIWGGPYFPEEEISLQFTEEKKEHVDRAVLLISDLGQYEWAKPPPKEQD